MDSTVILAALSALLAGTLAILVAWYERASLAFWSFVAGMVVLAVEGVFSGLTAAAGSPAEMGYWQDWRLVVTSLAPGVWLLFGVSYARATEHRRLARWRAPLAAALLGPFGLALIARPSLVVAYHRSLAGHWLLDLGRAGLVLDWLLVLGFVAVLVNLERTYRAAAGTMRWRIKFMILGAGLLMAVRVYSTSQELLFRATSLPLQTLNTVALLVCCLLMIRALFRSGQLEVKVYPSQFVLHHSFTATLSALYLGVMVGLVKLLTYIGGDKIFVLQTFLALVAVVLLSVLLLSERTRLYTRQLISRHFQRPQYDYRTVWRTFTESTARQVEPRDLCETVVKLVSELFQSLSVTIWLVDERKENLTIGASTSLSLAQAGELRLGRAGAAQVLGTLEANPEPANIDSCKQAWAILLRRLHPDEFRHSTGRICAPLVTRGELLGVMMLGDRVGDTPFSVQDFDLLKSVGEQTAASLLNIQLSQRLAHAKQLEAFQAMSAFFVHDLKNTASTLSLMLQNLPVHFDKPQFREDALRGVGKTVSHIRELISRLSALRRELASRTEPADLNTLITDALGALAAAPQTGLTEELQPLPIIQVDPAQIRDVITNLVLNARDAVAPGGQVHIQTSRTNGWAVLSVTDNGCGMSREFIQRQLYRPFQSTKKNGIGIGMFQCKIIVDAHHGKIEVESEPGKGTTFRVLLPIAPDAEPVRPDHPADHPAHAFRAAAPEPVLPLPAPDAAPV